MNRDRDVGRSRYGRGYREEDLDIGKDERGVWTSRRRGDYDREAYGGSAPRKPLHVVCVDELRDASAMKHALRSVPQSHRLLLVRGNDVSMTSGIRDTFTREERPSEEELRSRFLRMCKKHDVKCKYRSFDFSSNREFADKVCRLARKKGAMSVIVGKKEDVSDTRRSITGSISQSVLSSCGVPVTVVQTEAHRSSRA